MTTHEYWTKKQIVDSGRYPFTKGQLANFMLFRNENGLDIAVRKIGKCCYLRMDLFDQWMENHAEREEQSCKK